MKVSPELEAKCLALADAKPPKPETPAEDAKSEKAFQADVVKLAKRNGWYCYHVRFSQQSRQGWPDLVLWRERVVFVELKTLTGTTTPEQEEVLAGLTAAGAEVYLWRPSDWPTIEEKLR